MTTSRTAPVLLLIATLVAAAGCSKGGAGETSSTNATSGATVAKLAANDVPAKLTKAGWTFTTNDVDDQDGWPSRYIKMEKGKDDDYATATVWVDSLGEPRGAGAPAPHLEFGSGALLRFGFESSAPGKAAPDLAAFAKDLVAITPPEKATNGLFSSVAYDKAVAKNGLSSPSSGSGGRVSNVGVVFNHRTPSTKDGGRVAIEIVHYESAVKEGKAKLFGSTLVSVHADEPVRKEIFATLTK